MVAKFVITQMDKINYTFIIPHYNIPKLLGRCLLSIPERNDIQVIVVDDNSPCQSALMELVPELSRSNVELYMTPIGGSAGRARNVGIDKARGRWLSFIDADDFLVDNALDILDRHTANSHDIMFFQSKSVASNDITNDSDRNIFQYHFDTYFATANELPLRYEFDAPWGKFVKRELIEAHNIRFDEIRYSNDTFFSAAIGVYASSIYVSREIMYIVTEREGSLTSDKMKSLEEWRIRFGSAIRVQDFFDTHSISYKRYAFADFLLLMWGKDRSIFYKYFTRLSMRNKKRYLYYHIRNLITKLKNRTCLGQ